mmetsp:Transcript_5251/g.3969  ORF Transcript_5251/g.3969 Transcript_5251/m.3969 type:complete len:168 (-) Transcript_5251:1226-1729(-)
MKLAGYQSVLLPFKEQVLSTMFHGLMKQDEEESDELQQNEETEWAVSLAAGRSLEYLAQVLKDEVLLPVLEFSFPKLVSGSWFERRVGFLSLGAILEGPDPQKFMDSMNPYFLNILASLEDGSPKVKQTVAWVLYRLATCNPNIVFQSQDSVDSFIRACLGHCDSHP